MFSKKLSISSFEKRLAWHCHFIQKLYDEPEIEYENMNQFFEDVDKLFECGADKIIINSDLEESKKIASDLVNEFIKNE